MKVRAKQHHGAVGDAAPTSAPARGITVFAVAVAMLLTLAPPVTWYLSGVGA